MLIIITSLLALGLNSLYGMYVFSFCYFVIVFHAYCNVTAARYINNFEKINMGFFNVILVLSLLFLGFDSVLAIVFSVVLLVTVSLVCNVFFQQLSFTDALVIIKSSSNITEFCNKFFSRLLDIQDFFKFMAFISILAFSFLFSVLFLVPVSLQLLLCGCATLILGSITINFLINKCFAFVCSVFNLKDKVKLLLKLIFLSIYVFVMWFCELSISSLSNAILSFVLKMKLNFLPATASFSVFGVFVVAVLLAVCGFFVFGKYFFSNKKHNHEVVKSVKPMTNSFFKSCFKDESKYHFLNFNKLFVCCFMTCFFGFSFFGVVWYQTFILSMLLANNVALYYENKLKPIYALLVLNLVHLVTTVLGLGFVTFLMYSFSIISLCCGVNVCARSLQLNLISLFVTPALFLQMIVAEGLKLLANVCFMFLKLILDVVKFLLMLISISCEVVLYNCCIFVFGWIYSLLLGLVDYTQVMPAWGRVCNMFSVDWFIYVRFNSIYNTAYHNLNEDCENYVDKALYENCGDIAQTVCNYAETIYSDYLFNTKVAQSSKQC